MYRNHISGRDTHSLFIRVPRQVGFGKSPDIFWNIVKYKGGRWQPAGQGPFGLPVTTIDSVTAPYPRILAGFGNLVDA